MRKLYDTFFCRDMCVAEKTLRGVRVEPAAVSGQLGRSVQKPSRKSGDAAFFGSFIAALFCAHDETCHECSYFVMPDRQLCLERGAFLRYHIYIVHGRRFPRRSKRKAYPRLTRAYTPDGVRRSSRRSVSAGQVRSSFDGAERRPDDEKAAGNTLCIGKVFEDVWAFFLPVKTVCVLVNRG